MSDSKLVVLFVVPDTDTALVAILKAWRWVPVSLVCIRQIPQTCEHRYCRLTTLFTAQYGAPTNHSEPFCKVSPLLFCLYSFQIMFNCMHPVTVQLIAHYAPPTSKSSEGSQELALSLVPNISHSVNHKSLPCVMFP